MPQLSPMSWVLVFAVFLVCFVIVGVTVWWGVTCEYKVKGESGKSGFGCGS
uniref:ATP synthase F0 subunit 8 n=1 Tax=Chamberlainia hainesiana TaxID=1264661 RepID=A0A513X092_9BIVA|nr:ATP synthase F0 subunit 8 [Chamberlainia hainesiana]QDH07354.1 ATP synthase F0 subunit 8 [Chamberlainia hainesiana]